DGKSRVKDDLITFLDGKGRVIKTIQVNKVDGKIVLYDASKPGKPYYLYNPVQSRVEINTFISKVVYLSTPVQPEATLQTPVAVTHMLECPIKKRYEE
ncbi:hypothetical protein DRQ25_17150, partial [Candidatus Fermentibacteria bacterium]